VSNGTYTLEVFGKNIFNNKTPTNILRNANPNALATQGSNLIILAPPDPDTFGVRAVVHY
jgi:iron complex outermembrane receptor protein